MTALPGRPLTVLIAALGGEGGGVLADWLIDIATHAGFPVQSTSIPGVAQRTGATTYYIEIYPVPAGSLGGRMPVLALTPNPGNIDIMVASELIEAGRAMQNGYVSPDRTVLVASTHRVYAIAEKIAMGDGRFDSGAVLRAAGELARHAVLHDFAAMAQRTGSVINAVLLGAIAATGVLPFQRTAYEDAIRRSGKAVESSLGGFVAGFTGPTEASAPREPASGTGHAVEAVRRGFPAQTHRILEEGVARLSDYQDEDYARTYLDRLAPILALERGESDFALTAETGRHLALWMSYEDVIRVAALKIKPDRLARVRAEVGAKADEPISVVEYFKPGLPELCAVLPKNLAARVESLARTLRLEDRLAMGMHVRTTGVFGFLLLRALAGLKRWRRRSARFAEEQARIDRWLAAIQRHAPHDREAAIEIARCAGLLKGYGDTQQRGVDNYERVFAALIDRPDADAPSLRRAREAALANPNGESLTQTLAALSGPNELHVARCT